MTNFWHVLFGFSIGFLVMAMLNIGTIANMRNQNEELRATLAEPHHCVSVCADEFAKWGC